jgi:hypothetical protein
MFIGEMGVATSHHFLLPRDHTEFPYLAGQYKLELFARLSGEQHATILYSEELQLSPTDAAALQVGNSGLYFDWSPSAERFISHVEVLKPLELPPLVDRDRS